MLCALTPTPDTEEGDTRFLRQTILSNWPIDIWQVEVVRHMVRVICGVIS